MNKPALYSELYKLGQEVLQDNNPCKIKKDGQCMAGDCCCHGCPHLGPKGCTVEALSCKLWLCWQVQGTTEGIRAHQQLRIIRDIAGDHGVPLYIRKSKEETFARNK